MISNLISHSKENKPNSDDCLHKTSVLEKQIHKKRGGGRNYPQLKQQASNSSVNVTQTNCMSVKGRLMSVFGGPETVIAIDDSHQTTTVSMCHSSDFLFLLNKQKTKKSIWFRLIIINKVNPLSMVERNKKTKSFCQTETFHKNHQPF